MRFDDLPKFRQGPTGSLPLSVENGIIERVSLQNEGHGCLTGLVYLRYGKINCAFGGLRLAIIDPDVNNLLGHKDYPGIEKNWCGEWIVRVLHTVGAERWEDLKGRAVRVMEGWGGEIVAIGHFMNDEWFCPREEWKEIR